jgi:hypothetical protein
VTDHYLEAFQVELVNETRGDGLDHLFGQLDSDKSSDVIGFYDWVQARRHAVNLTFLAKT